MSDTKKVLDRLDRIKRASEKANQEASSPVENIFIFWNELGDDWEKRAVWLIATGLYVGMSDFLELYEAIWEEELSESKAYELESSCVFVNTDRSGLQPQPIHAFYMSEDMANLFVEQFRKLYLEKFKEASRQLFEMETKRGLRDEIEELLYGSVPLRIRLAGFSAGFDSQQSIERFDEIVGCIRSMAFHLRCMIECKRGLFNTEEQEKLDELLSWIKLADR